METTVSSPLEYFGPTLPIARLTADQYLEMARVGILTEDDKVELIDGYIVPMSPSGENHFWCVLRLTDAFAKALPTHFLAVQGSMRLGQGCVFDPDLALVRRRRVSLSDELPSASDVDLVIEVAHSSLKRDQTAKCVAYAEAGVPEYWIVELPNQLIRVYRDPSNGAFASVATFKAGDVLHPQACSEVVVDLSDLFGV